MGDVPIIQMNDVLAMLQQLQQENANLRNTLDQLQVAQAPVHIPTSAANSVLQASKEPRVSLPDKFDGNRAKFRDFVNKIRLIF